VTIDRTSDTTAEVTFRSLTHDNHAYLLVDGNTAALNVNSTDFDVTGATGSQLATMVDFDPPSLNVADPPGTSNVDRWGSFNCTRKNFDSFKNAASEITFTLTNNNGNWSSVNDVLVANADGYSVASHIAVATIAEDKNIYQKVPALDTGDAAHEAHPVDQIGEKCRISTH
jgi:hypothetical protein